MQQLRSSAKSILAAMSARQARRKAVSAWSSVQDTYYSTKDIFERHKIVFTVGTSIASVATAWIGYSIRVLHQKKVENRLDSIEQAMKQNAQLEKKEIKKIVNSGTTATSLATAGTVFLVGYCLGWRGGRWQARRQFRKEQMKLLGQPKRWQLLKGINPNRLQFFVGIKPEGWKLHFFKRPLSRIKGASNPIQSSDKVQENVIISTQESSVTQQSC